MAVSEIDPTKAYTFGGVLAYLTVGFDTLSKRPCVTVRQVGSHTLLAHSTDLQDITQRLTLVR